MKSITRNLAPTLVSISVLTIIFIISALSYAKIDPSDMRDLGIFPWDSGEYRRIADQLFNGNFSNLEGVYPFAPRLLFPATYSTLASYLNIEFIDAAYIVNLSSSFFITIFTYFFLHKNGISKTVAVLIAAIYIIFWLGPLRYTNFYPGGGFAFESAIICTLFLALETIGKKGLVITLTSSILIAVLTTGRELVFYLLCVALTFVILIRINPLNLFCHQKYIVNRKQMTSLLFSFIGSLIGYLIAKYLVTDTSKQYSVFNTVLEFSWFHLNIAEFLYPFFYALGPFFLSFLVAISISDLRRQLINKLLTETKQPFYVFVFLFCGTFFAMVGGTDSDRFLLWFYPFFALIGAQSIKIIWLNLQFHRKLIGIIFIIITALWTRFYTPAAPHVFFPGELYNSYAGVRTNMSPHLFYGPSFLESFRMPLKEIPLDDAYRNTIIDSISQTKQPIFISNSLNRDNAFNTGSPFKGSYYFELNNIPFPLGYTHNQYELLVAHPYHGNLKVKLMLLLQWIALYIILLFLSRRNLRLN